MPIIVSVVKHNNRIALKIESGYRCGELIQNSAGVQYFTTAEKAIEWAKETGYSVLTILDEVNPHFFSEQEFNSLRERNANKAEFCKENDINCTDIKMAHLEPEDFIGIPMLDRSTGNVTFLKPKF